MKPTLVTLAFQVGRATTVMNPIFDPSIVVEQARSMIEDPENPPPELPAWVNVLAYSLKDQEAVDMAYRLLEEEAEDDSI